LIVPSYEHDGLQLTYQVSGVGSPVLFVHGATGTGQYEWRRLVAALDAHHRCVTPDLRGHGPSDYRPGEMGIEYVCGDLLELISVEQLDRPHVVGFSFGSEVVLEFALTRPGTCKSLVLISPGLGDPKSSVPSRERMIASWPQSLRALHAETHGEEHWLEVMLELCERATVRPKADLEALGSIDCPILLIVGSDDDPRRVRQAEVFEAANERCRLTVVEGAGHAVHKARPDEVAACVADFLARVDDGSEQREVMP
jgi:pimeloyl-ACP methyl ester carboxylesterase